MIITFSGTDGVGKSTQLFRLMKLLESRGIDFRVQYVRGGNTPVTQIYRRIISRTSCTQLPSNKIVLAIGIAIAWIELAYCWIVKLRITNKPGRIVLCDRYLWDTYVDIKCRYPEWRGDGLPWKILEALSPAPDLSILYTAYAVQIAERLRQKEEAYSLPQIETALAEYRYLQNKFGYVIDSSDDAEAIFAQTIQALKDPIMHNKPDKYLKRILSVAKQICGQEGLITVSHIKKGHSNAVNYCISCNQKPLFFAKIHNSRIAGLPIINSLNSHSPSFTKVITDCVVGYRQRCLITEWVSGEELSNTADEARRVADILKMLHSASTTDINRRMKPKLELLRYMTYIKTRHVHFPHKREILRYLRQNQKLHRSTYALTHMDVHCGNFIADPTGTVQLIDYENMCITDPWRDFIYATTFHGRREDAFWLEVLLCYFDNQIPYSFWNTMKYYCYLHLLRMIICEHQKGNQWHIDYMVNSIWEDFCCQTQTLPQWYIKTVK